MSKNNDGGPAFPTDEMLHRNSGMTLRDYFAAHAPVTLQDARYACGYGGYAEGWGDAERVAAMAVLALMRSEYADTMLKARESN